jgi:hypothetical protein
MKNFRTKIFVSPTTGGVDRRDILRLLSGILLIARSAASQLQDESQRLVNPRNGAPTLPKDEYVIVDGWVLHRRDLTETGALETTDAE